MKKNSKSFVSSGKSCNFALAIQLWVVWSLGYGVMVTLQILVLNEITILIDIKVLFFLHY